ncbi:lipopolysaccharide biosynthesis protein [Xanthobacter pseudotagetidis]|uniref:lipopolysaccharide biosynthesis protein n=1 Tax=Xanthobacter pseudotagetidis TaxID=3119911 RepID=UPI003729AF26
MSTYFGVGVVQRLASLALIPAFSFFITPAEMGVLAVLLAIEALLLVLFDGALTSASVPYYFGRSRSTSERTISRVFIISAVVSAISGFIIYGLIELTWNLWTTVPKPSPLILAIVVVGALTQRMNIFAQQMYRNREQARAFAVMSLSRTAALLVVSLILVGVFHLGLLGIVLGRLLASIVSGFRELKSLVRPALRPHSESSLEPLTPLLFLALPLLVQQLATWARSFADKIVLSNLVPAADVGLYFTAALSGTSLSLIVVSFDSSFVTWYYNKRYKKLSDVHEITKIVSRVYIGCLGILCVFTMLSCPEIYFLIFKGGISAAGNIAPFTLAAQYLGAAMAFAGRVLVVHGRARVIPSLGVVGIVVGLSAMIPLVGTFGVAAAASGAAITFLIVIVGGWAVVRRIEPPDFSLFQSLATTALLGVFAMIIYRYGEPFVLSSMGLRLAAAALCVLAIAVIVGPTAWRKGFALFTSKLRGQSRSS